MAVMANQWGAGHEVRLGGTPLDHQGDEDVADQYDWYNAALAGEAPAISADKIESGRFFTKASKSGGRVPVAIWRAQDGAFRCRVGTKAKFRDVTEDEAADRWTYIAKNVVPRDEYKAAYETGVWPNNTPTTAPEAAASKSNLPTDPFEALKAEIDDKLASAEHWMQAHPQAQSKTDADYATNLQRELGALLKQADAMHGAEKAPLLAATRACDDKFRFRDKIKTVGTALKGIFERFNVAQEQIARKAAQAKFEADRKAAEAARAEAEKAYQRKLADDPIAALTDPKPELPELPLAPEPVKIQSGGGVGRAAGLKSEWIGVIEDYQLALAHFAQHPDVKAAVDKLVKAAARVGKSETKLPGVKIVEQRRAA